MENHSSKGFYFILGFSLVGYVVLGYYTERTDFFQLISILGILFGGYFYLVSAPLSESFIKQAIAFSLFFRMALLFMLPNLSDDYFRFLWDGKLSAHGFNPFAERPSTFIDSDHVAVAGISRDLYASLNSPGYYSIYPPVLQFIFWLSAKLFLTDALGSVIVMRMFIIAAETGSVFLIVKLLMELNLPSRNALLYALNPLVIIELSGNLHFEALMIFFLLLSVFLLIKKRFVISAVIFSLAISTKLIPLMFLPLLPRQIGIKRSLLFFSICGIITVLFFYPFLDRYFAANIFSAFSLYFQKFEFNAGIYYCIRWIGYELAGYNIIEKAGVILSTVSMIAILSAAFLQKKNNVLSFFHTLLFSITIYFAFATVVHPWYITSLVAIATFTSFKYPMIWSGLITLTYFTYQKIPYSENLLIVMAEYVVVTGVALYEWRKIRKAEKSTYKLL